jgi:hypothetical protein
MLKSLWLLLAVLSVATWFVAEKQWMTSLYYPMLFAFCIGSIVVAVVVCTLHRFSFRPLLIAFIMLTIGQWWAVQLIVLILSFGISGFAP